MPELPEVQTIINDLNRKIKGDTIVGFWTDWEKTIKGKSADEFTKKIIGRKVLEARRIGKNIFIDLSGGKTLYIHLKMTGHLLVKFSIFNFQFSKKSKTKISKSKTYFKDKVNQYIHHIWKLKSGKTLEFSDLRKFGKIVLDDTEKISNLKEIKALGMDAMSVEFSFKKFQEIISKKSNAKIGILLMEQNLIAGIGNIYRSEILYESGVMPERKAGDLNSKEIKSIYGNIKKVLKKGLKITFQNYWKGFLEKNILLFQS